MMSWHPVVAVVTIHGMSHYITMGFHTLTLYRLHYLCKDEDLLTYSFLLMEVVCSLHTQHIQNKHEGLVCTLVVRNKHKKDRLVVKVASNKLSDQDIKSVIL